MQEPAKGAEAIKNMHAEMLEAWIKREHPSGQIDWRKEYERLLSTLEQTVENAHFSGAAAEGIAKTAILTGQYLLNRNSK